MILLENGRFYTPSHPNTTSMLVEGGQIKALGGNGLGADRSAEITERFNLNGRVIWPGLTDAHIHLSSYSLNLTTINCETDSLQECLNRIEAIAAHTPKDTWIRGHGWNQNNWPEGYGTACQLDSVSHGHAVFLTAKSLHSAWVNSRAMQLAGVTSATADPDGGRILRDEFGNPTGIFLEKAEGLISSIIPKETGQVISQAIIKGVESLSKMGITSVHDFDALDRLDQYQQLEAAGKLYLRILKVIPPDDHLKALESGYHTGMGKHQVHIGPYKYFMDGALGPHTAAMFEPYEDDPTNVGILNHTAEDVVESSRNILETGSDLSIHAIGDRANMEAIKAYRSIREMEKASGRKPARLRIEHVQLISSDNLASFQQLGIHASMQPLHATSDMEMADKYWGKRVQLAYAWNSILSSGANLVFGSDAPVESPDPFRGLHAAVTRQRNDDQSEATGWVPGERITLKAALDAYTTGPAKLNRHGIKTGTLEAGYAADLILLNTDPFREKAQELHQIKPVATMFNGQWVWIDQGVEL
jgi:predicted amidohydrolase YtcJ